MVQRKTWIFSLHTQRESVTANISGARDLCWGKFTHFMMNNFEGLRAEELLYNVAEHSPFIASLKIVIVMSTAWCIFQIDFPALSIGSIETSYCEWWTKQKNANYYIINFAFIMQWGWGWCNCVRVSVVRNYFLIFIPLNIFTPFRSISTIARRSRFTGT